MQSQRIQPQDVAPIGFRDGSEAVLVDDVSGELVFGKRLENGSRMRKIVARREKQALRAASCEERTQNLREDPRFGENVREHCLEIQVQIPVSRQELAGAVEEGNARVDDLESQIGKSIEGRFDIIEVEGVFWGRG